MNVRIATFAPFPSPRDAMPYRCKKKHKQGDIVEICGEQYIITEESIQRYGEETPDLNSWMGKSLPARFLANRMNTEESELGGCKYDS